jgi:cytochrome c oxidase subunit 2
LFIRTTGNRSHWLLCLLPLLWLSGCAAEAPSALAPQSPAAERLAALWWFLFGLGSAIYLVVIALLLYALFRPRHNSVANLRWQQRGKGLILFGGALVPAVLLLVIYGVTLNALSVLAAAEGENNLTIEMIGHQWWWEIHYPDGQVTTANELHIPVGQPVTIRLSADDVIHSFWVPELNGKLDLIPGKTNLLSLQADKAGEYWGLCAEYCGIQHAKMLFVVVAQPEDEFDRWLEEQQAAAAEPADEQSRAGQAIFFEVGCDECHVIRGTAASGDLGPDLTHFASRRTLGAGIAPNNRGNLAGWIVDSHGLKPGNLMPPSELTGPQLQALLAYMETLK